MFTQWMVRTKLVPVLAGVLFGCLALPAHGDEIQYLPSGAHVVMSANFQDVLKSKAFQEMKTMMKQFSVKNPGMEVDVEKEIVNSLGIPAANIARVTQGLALPEKRGPGEDVAIVTTLKPVTAAAIIAAKKPSKYRKNVTYKEVKIGKYTVHEENFQVEQGKDKLSEVIRGQAFCVVEGNIVLLGSLQGWRDEKDEMKTGLRKVLERNKSAELSTGMQAGLKNAAFTNSAVVVVDIQGLPAFQKTEMFRGLGMPGLKEVGDNLQTLTVKVNEPGKLNAVATLYCKDAATATQAVKIVEAGVANIKGMLKDDPKNPPEAKEMINAAQDLLAAIKVSAKDNQTTAEATIEPATAVKFFMGSFLLMGNSAPDVPKTKVIESK